MISLNHDAAQCFFHGPEPEWAEILIRALSADLTLALHCQVELGHVKHRHLAELHHGRDGDWLCHLGVAIDAVQVLLPNHKDLQLFPRLLYKFELSDPLLTQNLIAFLQRYSATPWTH